jgi:hypothetical protein
VLTGRTAACRSAPELAFAGLGARPMPARWSLFQFVAPGVHAAIVRMAGLNNPAAAGHDTETAGDQFTPILTP